MTGRRGGAGGIRILLVEDNTGDVRLVREALREVQSDVDLEVIADGAAALGRLRRRERPLPHLVLLDLNLPGLDGRQVLRALKADPDLRRLPVVVLSSSGNARDVCEAYDLQASCYLVKAPEVGQFVGALRAVEELWARQAALPDLEAG